jgi:hypothetical protein
MLDVLGEHGLQMPTAEDEHPVEALAPQGADHALTDGVRSGCQDRALDDPGALCGEDGVEGSRELGVAIADEELDGVCLVGEVHREIAGLLGHPIGYRLGGHAGEAAKRLRAEYLRICALHERSLKLAAAAQLLHRAVSTVGLMVKRGELEVDPETNSSNAVFVTRESVDAARAAHTLGPSKSRIEKASVPLADVIRFTGRSRTELLDLLRAGVLEQVPGRQVFQLTASSLRNWMAASV